MSWPFSSFIVHSVHCQISSKQDGVSRIQVWLHILVLAVLTVLGRSSTTLSCNMSSFWAKTRPFAIHAACPALLPLIFVWLSIFMFFYDNSRSSPWFMWEENKSGVSRDRGFSLLLFSLFSLFVLFSFFHLQFICFLSLLFSLLVLLFFMFNFPF